MPNYTYYVGMSSYTNSFYHFGLPNASELRKGAASVVGKIKNTISGVQGKTEREWKKHKWVARKRGPGGKWIYDYGNGYPDEKKTNKKRVRKTDGQQQRAFKDLRADGNDRNYVVSNGRKVRKSEDGEAYTKVNNKVIYGRDEIEASRKAAAYELKRRRQNRLNKGRQIY